MSLAPAYFIGDVSLDEVDVARFVAPHCLACGADTLKPDVVFFGGAVDKPTVQHCFDLTDAARAWLGRVGYDPVYGARPLKRAVQKYLQDPLAELILRGQVKDGQTVTVEDGDGLLRLSVG